MPPKKSQLLEDQEYYHGLLPREDLPGLLVDKGDFLVRTSEPAADQGNKQICICVRTTKNPNLSREARKTSTITVKSKEVVSVVENKEDVIRNIIVQSQGKKFLIQGNAKSFKSVAEMINYFVKEKTPIIKNTDIILKKPIKQQSWELKHDDLQTKEKLGSGAFGDVLKGFLMKKGGKRLPVAIKVAKGDQLDKDKMRAMMKEARIMRKFDHPNVVKLYGVAVEQEPFMIVMELINGPSVDKYLQENCITAEPSEREKIHLMCAAAAYGLAYLHNVRVLHRDIAARNCLYSSDKVLKITDFGMTHEGEEYKLTGARKLPVRWLSPETMNEGVHTSKSDVFSYGILVWEIFSNGQEPFVGMNNLQIQQMVVSGGRLEMPFSCPEDLTSKIMKFAWNKSPDARWNMGEFVEYFEKEYNTKGPKPTKPGKETKLSKTSLTETTETLEEGAKTAEEEAAKPKEEKKQRKERAPARAPARKKSGAAGGPKKMTAIKVKERF